MSRTFLSFCLKTFFLTIHNQIIQSIFTYTKYDRYFHIEYHLLHSILITCLYNSSSVMEPNPYICPITCTLLLPLPVFTTCTCAGIRSVISATWEITPILRPCICNRSKASIAMRRVSISNDPKPSSINSDSTFIRLEDKEDKPNAKARDTKKDSPPEREWTLRTSPIISRSTICKASVSGIRCNS